MTNESSQYQHQSLKTHYGLRLFWCARHKTPEQPVPIGGPEIALSFQQQLSALCDFFDKNFQPSNQGMDHFEKDRTSKTAEGVQKGFLGKGEVAVCCEKKQCFPVSIGFCTDKLTRDKNPWLISLEKKYPFLTLTDVGDECEDLKEMYGVEGGYLEDDNTDYTEVLKVIEDCALVQPVITSDIWCLIRPTSFKKVCFKVQCVQSLYLDIDTLEHHLRTRGVEAFIAQSFGLLMEPVDETNTQETSLFKVARAQHTNDRILFTFYAGEDEFDTAFLKQEACVERVLSFFNTGVKRQQIDAFARLGREINSFTSLDPEKAYLMCQAFSEVMPRMKYVTQLSGSSFLKQVTPIKEVKDPFVNTVYGMEWMVASSPPELSIQESLLSHLPENLGRGVLHLVNMASVNKLFAQYASMLEIICWAYKNRGASDLFVQSGIQYVEAHNPFFSETLLVCLKQMHQAVMCAREGVGYVCGNFSNYLKDLFIFLESDKSPIDLKRKKELHDPDDYFSFCVEAWRFLGLSFSKERLKEVWDQWS